MFVRCSIGAIFDVAVDLRRTFDQLRQVGGSEAFSAESSSAVGAGSLRPWFSGP